MQWASIFISGSAFLTALAALAVSYLQLREARTSTGGRGMYMYFRPIKRDDVSPAESALIDETLFALTSKNPNIQLTAIQLTVEVQGPAAFYEVRPYTWGEAGMPDNPLAFKPVKKLTCESDPTTFVVMIQTELLPTMKLGVVWLQPWQRGLEASAIRSNTKGDLEEWVFYSRFRRIFAKMFCVRGLCTLSVMTLCTLSVMTLCTLSVMTLCTLNVMTLCMHSVMTLCTPETYPTVIFLGCSP